MCNVQVEPLFRSLASYSSLDSLDLSHDPLECLNERCKRLNLSTRSNETNEFGQFEILIIEVRDLLNLDRNTSWTYSKNAISQSFLPSNWQHDWINSEWDRFVRSNQVDPSTLSWEDQVAAKYYDSLFKEFAIVNLKHWSTGAVRLPFPLLTSLHKTKPLFSSFLDRSSLENRGWSTTRNWSPHVRFNALSIPSTLFKTSRGSGRRRRSYSRSRFFNSFGRNEVGGIGNELWVCRGRG